MHGGSCVPDYLHLEAAASCGTCGSCLHEVSRVYRGTCMHRGSCMHEGMCESCAAGYLHGGHFGTCESCVHKVNRVNKAICIPGGSCMHKRYCGEGEGCVRAESCVQTGSCIHKEGCTPKGKLCARLTLEFVRTCPKAACCSAKLWEYQQASPCVHLPIARWGQSLCLWLVCDLWLELLRSLVANIISRSLGQFIAACRSSRGRASSRFKL